MNTIAERLKSAREEAELTQPQLASRAGVSAGTIGNIESGARKNPRELLAIAKAVGVHPQWLRDGVGPRRVGDSKRAGDSKSTGEPDVEHIGPAPTQRLVAVIGRAQLGENGYYDLVPAGSDGYVEAVSGDPDAYVLRVVGDSMFPAIRNGWYVLVEPNRAPHPTDYVAVAAKDGRKMVKEFLYQTETEIGLQSVNGGGRLTLPLTEVVTVHPIGNLLSPSKHRTA